MAEDPRFQTFTKKDGTPAYLQKMPANMKETEGMNRHAYIMTVPTFDFTVLGQPMRSGTELRNLYSQADGAQRQEIVKELFGRYTQEAEQIMNNKLPVQQAEPVNECGGVGVVKGGNDPRYSVATMGDQNDVTPATLGKEMKAYGLVGRKNPGQVKHQTNVRKQVGQGK